MFASITRLIDRWKRRQGPRLAEILADHNGVSVLLDDGMVSPRFRWADVTEIRTFKVDLVTVDDIRLAFQAGDFWYEYSEDIKGFWQLSERMMKEFPAIPRDWYMVVMQPPFATNERVLFRRAEGGRGRNRA